ncbi:MAG: Fur family transcriptional regulator [Desulfuromonadaceae bacterium]
MDEFEKAFRASGLKITHQRMEIYRELARAKDHPAAETLHKRLQQKIPTISLDTIYRTLSSLEQHGLICRINSREKQARYDADRRRHHHLVCTQCKQILDFQWEAFDRSEPPAELKHWGRLLRRDVILYGICGKCSESM